MKRFELSLIIGLFISIAFSSVGAFAQDCDYLRENVLRIHILANSDSQEDQALKLQVRDAILAASDEIFEDSQSLMQAETNIARKMQRIEEISEEIIAVNGHSFTAEAKLVNMYFDTRHYDGFDMPAGRYDAIRVTIGSGEGKNWWCVAYPPMCIDAASPQGAETKEKILSLGAVPVYKPKLAVVEIYEKIKESFSPKGNDITDIAIDGQS